MGPGAALVAGIAAAAVLLAAALTSPVHVPDGTPSLARLSVLQRSTTPHTPRMKPDSALRHDLGTTPPGTPTVYCDPVRPTELAVIDFCRAGEGVGPLELPTNFATLTVPEQLLVVFDLERVNRGEPPIVGLSPALNQYAQDGARNGTDPHFPSCDCPGGSIWDATRSTDSLGADAAFMYTDDCSPTKLAGCWGHRDLILENTSTEPLVGGGGYSANGYAVGDTRASSYTFEFLYGFPTADLTFTWAKELRYFTSPPGLEPLPAPRISGVTPSVGAVEGGTRITVTGSDLSSTTRIDIGGRPVDRLACASDTECNAIAPAGRDGGATVSVTSLGGTATEVGAFTYGLPELALVSGNRQAAALGLLFAPLVAEVTLDGAPVAHAPVVFVVVAGRATFLGASRSVEVASNDLGQAVPPPVRAGEPGAVVVAAHIPGSASRVHWQLTAEPRAG